MLKSRVLTSFGLLFLLYILFFLIDKIQFSCTILVLCVVAFYELMKMYKFSRLNQIVVITLFIFVSSLVKYNIDIYIKILIALVWCIIVPAILIVQPKQFSKLFISILGIGLFLPAFYVITILYNICGVWQLLSIMAVAWIADIGAFFVGRFMGKYKLAPSISPGKTIEGALGGLILVIIYFTILKYVGVSYLHSYSQVVIFSLALAIFSIIGDLLESWLKRVAKVKDSGNILPGHGGVFDRIDSLIAVLAIAFCMRGAL